MMNDKIKILVAEHDPQDIELIENELKQGGLDYIIKVVKTEQHFRNALEDFIPEIILSDYNFPSFSGTDAFKIRNELIPHAPFIFVSGAIGEENSIELIKNGVTDFVLKEKIFGLNTKLIRALKDADEQKDKLAKEKEFRRSEARLAQAQAIAKVGSWETDLIHLKGVWSKETFRIFGVDPESFQVSHQGFLEFVHPEDREKVNSAFLASMGKYEDNGIVHRIVTPDGIVKVVEECWRVLRDDKGQPISALGTCQDITERQKAEALINESEAKYRAFFESSMDGILLTITDGEILAANPAACEIFQMTEDEICAAGRVGLCDSTDPRLELLLKERQRIGRAKGELTLIRKDGSRFPGELTSTVFTDGYRQQRTSMIVRDLTENKQAEEQLADTTKNLQKALNELKKIMDSSLDVICAVDINGHFIEVSAACENVWGYKQSELTGKPYMNFVYVPDHEKTIRSAEYIMAGHNINHFENRYIHRDGSLIPIEWSAGWDEKDQVMYCIARDVTEKKRLEKAFEIESKKIEESEKRYRQIVETAQEGIWLIDADNRTTFANQKMCEILGYPEAEIMGKEIYAFMDEEGKKIAADLMIKKKEGHADQVEFKYISKTGKEIWTNISANPLFSENGIYSGSLAMVTDITENKRAERKDRFQATLLNTIGQATIATDLKGKINFWNKAAEKIYGWTAEEALGKNIMELTPTKQSKVRAEEIMQELSQGHSWGGELMVQRKDGINFPAFITNAPIYNRHQQLSGIIGVSYDITDLKLSEVRLNALNESLQKQAKELATSNAELEQFAYVTSHDLQEPLRMVTSFLTQLDKKYGSVLDEKAKMYIGFAVDGAKRMRQIILDLLEFSRVGKMEDKQEFIDIKELLDEIKILFRKQIREKKATIISNDLPKVFGHRSPVRQVFQNLISNALKYTRNDKPVKINIAVQEEEDHWRFAVKDNGIGIEEEYFDKIFIIFQRLHNKEEFSGTGMGLALTKKIIENRGGKIWVESEEGKGSTFYFTMPKQ